MKKPQQKQAPKNPPSKPNAAKPAKGKPTTTDAAPKQTDDLDLKRAEGEGMTPAKTAPTPKIASPDGLEGDGSATVGAYSREGVEKPSRDGKTKSPGTVAAH